MKAEVLFEEVQSFSKRPLQLFCKISIGVLIVALGIVLLIDKGEPGLLATMFFWALIVCIIIAFFTSFKMVTQIRTDGIYINYLPLQPWFTGYLWNDVETLYMRKYDAACEYLGSGIRIGPMGWGYIHSGDTGLQLILHDHTKVLVGTHRPDEMEAVLHSLKLL